MGLVRWVSDWIGRRLGMVGPEGQACRNCCHFIDHTDPPDDLLGYCGELVDRLGLEKALERNEYGGHWTHVGDWCSRWEDGEPVWTKEGVTPLPPPEGD